MYKYLEQIEKIKNYWMDTFCLESTNIKMMAVPFKYCSITESRMEQYEVAETKTNCNNSFVKIGSAEQTFLYLFFTNSFKFPFDEWYESTTKCSRPNDFDPPFSYPEFTKSELFIRLDPLEGTLSHNRLVNDLVVIAKDAFEKAGLIREKITTVTKTDELSGVETEASYSEANNIYQLDLIYDGKYELGSYGVRDHTMNDKRLIWAYGTIVAYERFEAIMDYQMEQNSGYHTYDIPKGTLGQADKITEEYLEFIDAVRQNNRVMALVELSDLMGAIQAYLKTQDNINLRDLLIMKDATERAFKNGDR